MTEAPRPPGDGTSGQPGPDPAAPPPPPYSVPDPNAAPGYAPPPSAAPPPGGYPPPGGGYPAGPGVPPPGYASADDKTWALIAHFGGAAGMLIGGGAAGWIAPLIALLAKGNQSPTVRAHAVAALNFQIVWSVVGLIGWMTVCILIGFLGVFAAMAMGIIFGVIAGMKANEGQFYRYPASLSIVK